VSERHFQTNLTGQWTKGKSCDTFGPLGPWLVTRDEVLDPQNLNMTLDVNGTRRQTGNTKTMIFSVAEIIEHLSGLI
jgi:2-keto-4-pentenoate hydratase/2-oxohepta-3-ene-1,7-dioic acid hydratase in catechol pathway